MQNVQRFIPAAIDGLKNNDQSGLHAHQTHQKQGRSISSHDVEIIKNVFIALQGNFPAWKQVWPDLPSLNTAKKEWTKALIEAGISSMEQIQNGLRQCRQHSSNWPPSTGVFIKWCKQLTDTPESLGLPSIDKAYMLACQYAYPSFDHSRCIQAVYHAACETGLHFLMSESQYKTRKSFDRNYHDAIQIVAIGGLLRALPPPPERLLPAKTSGDSKRTGLAALAGLKRKVGGSV
jgi:hypothetical protein